MRALVLLHRWLGVAFCLLFAMWFASGMVMHFVPFPALSEAERVAGLTSFDPASVARTPRDALIRLGGPDVQRLRLAAPAGDPVYIGTRQDSTISALDARSGKKLIVDGAYALASARAHARASGIEEARAALVATEAHDQWSVPNGFDAHRPLHRIALDNDAGTVLYVSSVTGEVVLDTHRFERVWNWAGSILHWIYPTILRKHWAAWDSTVWWLSLAAMIGALTGTALGVLRLNARRSPFRGWMRWHHILGLSCALFVLTWIFSGWLSMDHGLLFSNGKPSADERGRIHGPALAAASIAEWADIQTPFREMEWFGFAGQTGMRVIDATGARRLRIGTQDSAWLSAAQVNNAARLLGSLCTRVTVIPADDAYAARSVAADAPVYRIACGETWFHIDGANGRVIEKLDSSRRAYRWAYQALHTLDFPGLAQRQMLRRTLIVVLCMGGLAFSLTGAVIGWRRLKRSIRRRPALRYTQVP